MWSFLKKCKTRHENVTNIARATFSIIKKRKIRRQVLIKHNGKSKCYKNQQDTSYVHELSKVGVLTRPLGVSIDTGENLYVADYTKGCVKTIKLHYPAVVTTVGNSLDKPVGLPVAGGVGLALVSDHSLKYFEVGGQIQLSIKAALHHVLLLKRRFPRRAKL